MLKSGADVRLELFETPTDIQQLQNMLIAELTDNKNERNLPDDKFQEAIEEIKSLSMDDFNHGITEDTAQPGDSYKELEIERLYLLAQIATQQHKYDEAIDIYYFRS